jgi:carboxypeptidase C (cathepsin A)
MTRFISTLILATISLLGIGQSSPLSNDASISVTKHTVTTASGKVLKYTATSGYMQLETEDAKAKAKMFFTAYTLDDVADIKSRAITYTFNGGPGSSSVWLHMGALGPKRVLMNDDGSSLKPPYKSSDNSYTWLEFTDLVFIDPVMTGYSRPATGVDKKEFLGYEEDIQTMGQFIQLFSSRSGRWASPKYLAGESYGTTRAAGLTNHLIDRYGMYLNGVVMISSIMNFGTARFDRGNDLPYALFLPTYAATAWYHKKLDSRYDNLERFLDEVRAFAIGEYSTALAKGDKLSDIEINTIADKLSKYTGLSTAYLKGVHLRIDIGRFCKELRRSEGKTVGRLDSRFVGFDYDDGGERTEYDPSYDDAIYGPYTAALYDHIKNTLKVNLDLPYEILTDRARPWNYANVSNRYLNVAEDLRIAMTQNPSMKVLVCNGYYDLATPFFATEYTYDHMYLQPQHKANVTMKYYPAGHMMYIQKESLIKFTDDVRSFYGNR